MADNHHAQRGDALSMYHKYLGYVMTCVACAEPPAMCPMGRALKTTVKWYRSGKSFGLIEQDGGGPDVFAHYSDIFANGFCELVEGGKVSFDVAQGQKGPQAENIVRG